LITEKIWEKFFPSKIFNGAQFHIKNIPTFSPVVETSFHYGAGKNVGIKNRELLAPIFYYVIYYVIND